MSDSVKPLGAVSLELPWPPSSNHLYATVRGRRVLSRAGREYQTEVGEIVIQHRSKHYFPYMRRLKINIYYHAPHRRAYDIMNFNKCLLDGLTKVQLYGDDSQIDDIRQRRGPMKKPGRVIILIAEME